MYKLLHFTADWCVPCQKSKPLVNKFVEENNVDYQVIDIDREFHTAGMYEVKSIPTFISLKDGEYYDRHVGVPTEEILKNLLSS